MFAPYVSWWSALCAPRLPNHSVLSLAPSTASAAPATSASQSTHSAAAAAASSSSPKSSCHRL